MAGMMRGRREVVGRREERGQQAARREGGTRGRKAAVRRSEQERRRERACRKEMPRLARTCRLLQLTTSTSQERGRGVVVVARGGEDPGAVVAVSIRSRFWGDTAVAAAAGVQRKGSALNAATLRRRFSVTSSARISNRRRRRWWNVARLRICAYSRVCS